MKDFNMEVEYDGIAKLFFATGRIPGKGKSGEVVCLACSENESEAVEWLDELLESRMESTS